ncbi:hypothetical protein AK812_SmicGene43095 [Symbiodinium microadriaticum]|uniref:Uncharacterized protein n=1 Tax=Symbiodinium microadriaticum TaxID=2951 RepID=A0A1Q9C1X9_SYMMI|nr:hypothetical protein AK812_SmicGene43095 [Symbiodinium microadriaticum]
MPVLSLDYQVHTGKKKEGSTLLDVKSEASHLKALLQEIQPLVPRLQSGGAKSEVLRRANASVDADETTDHVAPLAAIGWFSGDAADRHVAVLSVTRLLGCVELVRMKHRTRL